VRSILTTRMQVQKVIQELGYTAREAKVYLATLGLGEVHISDVAAKVKMPRTSVQGIMDTLHDAGLVNFYVMRRYKYWVAESPERLLAQLEKKRVTIAEALPALSALRKEGMGRRKERDADWTLFRALADSSQQPVLIADEETSILYVNKPWEKLFGYSLSEVRGQRPRMFQSRETPREEYERMWKYLGTERIFQSKNIIDKTKKGDTFKMLTTIMPLRHNGHLFYVQILDVVDASARAEVLSKQFQRTANGKS
jgi:PAS domain S-box-containing protein